MGGCPTRDGSPPVAVVHRSGPSFAALFAICLACARVSSAGPAPPPEPTGTPVGDPSAAPSSSGWARVIVELRLDAGAAPETGIRSSDGRPVEPKRIAAARQALLASLDPRQARLVRAFEVVPFVALEVSPEGRAALARSPLVAGVREDLPQSISK